MSLPNGFTLIDGSAHHVSLSTAKVVTLAVADELLEAGYLVVAIQHYSSDAKVDCVKVSSLKRVIAELPE